MRYDKPIDVREDKKLGYAYFLDREHPLASRQGKVYYHRHVASLKLGRWLKPEEVVHHVDGNKLNNSMENIVVVKSTADHTKMHNPPKKEPVRCAVCGKKAKDPAAKKFCSQACSQKSRRKVKRPTKRQLEREMKRMSMLALGRKYEVSDNAVRKWAKGYGLL